MLADAYLALHIIIYLLTYSLVQIYKSKHLGNEKMSSCIKRLLQ